MLWVAHFVMVDNHLLGKNCGWWIIKEGGMDIAESMYIVKLCADGIGLYL